MIDEVDYWHGAMSFTVGRNLSQRLVVSGPAACFARPDTAGEDITYEVITPMAARGIFESVHWTPAISWRIMRIEVLCPIQTQWLEKGQSYPGASGGGRGSPVPTLVLLDVGYVIHARFEMTRSAGPADSPAQHANMFRRRAKNGRHFRTPYLGKRDLVADVRLLKDGEGLASYYRGEPEIDLGWMVYDRSPVPAQHLLFHHAVMRGGIIDLADVAPIDLSSQ